MNALQPRTANDYAQQLQSLLPRGAAWDYAPDGAFAALLLAMAEEFARIDRRSLDVLEEADPRTALEMLPDWERVAGLPDTCVGEPDSVAERHAALVQKLTRPGSQSIAAFKEIAARAGYAIEIEEHRPARCDMDISMRCNGIDWAFAWTVHVKPLEEAEEGFEIAEATVDDRCDIRLRGWGALNLECLIERAAPAHTKVLFAYVIEPEAAFWINFTQ